MRSILGFCYGILVLVAAVIAGLLIGTLGVLPFVVVPRGRRFMWAMPAAQLWARVVVATLGVYVEVDGDWPLPEGRGALIFCNHRSWLDPLVLMAWTRSNGLSKSQILWLPFIGLYGWLSGGVFFNRNDKEQRARARIEVLELVRAGHRLQVFPEGTRVKEAGTRERVYLRLGMDAWNEGLPVVPCAIAFSEDVLPPGVLRASWGRTVRLRILPPLDPAAYSGSREYAQATWDAVRQAYDEMVR